MAARAIWKGILNFENIEVPVKLYSAVEDRNIRFRLLHRKDGQPVKQTMVNPEDGSLVPYQETQRVYHTEEGAQVLINRDELEDLKPEKSRIIEVISFLPTEAIDHRWYDRPYYLGADGSEEIYGALAGALQRSDREGLVHWVMRNKEYFGALRLFHGYPMLMSLRYREEVISAAELQPPKGKALDKRELSMARQLIEMLESSFDPQEYRDEYRERVQEMIDKKHKGETIKRPAPSKKKSTDDLSAALEASLKGGRDG